MSDDNILGKIAYAGATTAARAWEENLRSSAVFPHEEVEAAFQDYVHRANVDDWEYYSDLFTDPCIYIDHHFGTVRSPRELSDWMVPLMKTQPEMRFIPGWHVIHGNMVINYNWNRWPNPEGSPVPYDEWRNPGPVADYRFQFPCVTMCIYAGNGKFCFEEDIYSPAAYLEIRNQWRQAMGMDDAD